MTAFSSSWLHCSLLYGLNSHTRPVRHNGFIISLLTFPCPFVPLLPFFDVQLTSHSPPVYWLHTTQDVLVVTHSLLYALYDSDGHCDGRCPQVHIFFTWIFCLCPCLSKFPFHRLTPFTHYFSSWLRSFPFVLTCPHHSLQIHFYSSAKFFVTRVETRRWRVLNTCQTLISLTTKSLVSRLVFITTWISMKIVYYKRWRRNSFCYLRWNQAMADSHSLDNPEPCLPSRPSHDTDIYEMVLQQTLMTQLALAHILKVHNSCIFY